MRWRHRENQGFTLIELSIVLVIIGLIIGGVLVGQDMISAAATRAQISQIEKYNTAVNTFKIKYGYLPGDIPDPYASQFGFQARGTWPGQGDGNGILEGYPGCDSYGWLEGAGETVMFWVDLSAARLIDVSFNTASPTALASSDITGTTLGQYFPPAKIGNGNYIYAWTTSNSTSFTGFNNPYPGLYFGISAPYLLANGGNQGRLLTSPGITVAQAYSIDKKIDDGLPLNGNVQAIG